MNIYVASSWRNLYQPLVVLDLRALGHEVYDFKEGSSFRWKDIGPWTFSEPEWTPEACREALKHPLAERGYRRDIDALRACDACVLVLPAGRSASWEAGYAAGQGKRLSVLVIESGEPELMFSEAEILISMVELRDAYRSAP